MNVTGNGVAIGLACAIAIAFLLFGASFLTLPFGGQSRQASMATTSDAAASTTGALVLPVNQNQNTMNESEPQQLPTELTARDEVVGTGAEAKTGNTVTVTYVGAFPDGTVFDASKNHAPGTFTFTLGQGRVIQGWDLGVVGMKVGGKRQLIVPPDMGYGPGGSGPIPPNATLIFEIELLEVK